MHDPETYSAELIAALTRYPVWVGERAILEARRGSPKFVPSVAEVEGACEAIFAPARHSHDYATEWNTRAALQLAERHEREAAYAAGPPPEVRRLQAQRVIREVAAGMSMSNLTNSQVSRETPARERFPWEEPEGEAAGEPGGAPDASGVG